MPAKSHPRRTHINNDGTINIIWVDRQVIYHSLRRPLHKRYQETNYVYYWDYHNVYIDGVQVIDPELPSFKKVHDEIADLKSNYSLLMSIVKSQKEELDILKSAITTRDNKIDRLVEELQGSNRI